MKLLRAGEDYLKAILILQRQNGKVRSLDVAEYLNVTKPSVSNAIRRLREGEFLTLDAKKRLILTPSGQEAAEHIYEKYCSIKNGLISLGVDPEIAERDACQLEHVLSRESYEKLQELWEKQTPAEI